MARITTEQAPSAKPISIVRTLTTSYQTIVEVDDYDIPIIGFGGQRRIAPGVVEITSPLILTNVSNDPATVTVRFVKDGTNFVIANQIPVEVNDVVYIPLNGQFMLSATNDRLQVIASNDNRIVVTLSFTQGQAEEDNPFGDE